MAMSADQLAKDNQRLRNLNTHLIKQLGLTDNEIHELNQRFSVPEEPTAEPVAREADTAMQGELSQELRGVRSELESTVQRNSDLQEQNAALNGQNEALQNEKQQLENEVSELTGKLAEATKVEPEQQADQPSEESSSGMKLKQS